MRNLQSFLNFLTDSFKLAHNLYGNFLYDRIYVFIQKGIALANRNLTLSTAQITIFQNLVELGYFVDKIEQTYSKGDPISYTAPYLDTTLGFEGLWTFNV